MGKEAVVTPEQLCISSYFIPFAEVNIYLLLSGY